MKKIENLFLCVGAQKSGTSWLYNVFSRDPSIQFSKYKEIHYFDMVNSLNNELQNRILYDLAESIGVNKETLIQKFFNNSEEAVKKVMDLCNDEWYINQFNGKSKYSADFTPSYALLNKEGINHIKKISNNQKIIFIMRDPVKRSLSALQYYYRNNSVNLENLKDKEIIEKLNSNLILSRSKYEDTIQVLKSEFDDEDVLFLFYEEVMSDKKFYTEKVFDFLGIKSRIIKDKVLEKKVNTSKKVFFSNDVMTKLESNLLETKLKVRELIGYVPDTWNIDTVDQN